MDQFSLLLTDRLLIFGYWCRDSNWALFIFFKWRCWAWKQCQGLWPLRW